MSASLALCEGDLSNSPHKEPVIQKAFLCYDVFINRAIYEILWAYTPTHSHISGIVLCMGSANERRRYIVTSSLIGWAHTQNDPGEYMYSSTLFALSISPPWWRHQMETFSAWLTICAENSLVRGEFPAQRPVTRSFDVFFDLCPNKRLSKQSWGWWFETPSRRLWRHCNDPTTKLLQRNFSNSYQATSQIIPQITMHTAKSPWQKETEEAMTTVNKSPISVKLLQRKIYIIQSAK